MFPCVLRRLTSWTEYEDLGGLAGTMDKITMSEPGAALPTAFLLCGNAFCMAGSPQDPETRRKISEAEQMSLSSRYNERERKHLKAAALFTSGEMPGAECVWESILDEFPNDLMALKFAHDSYFFSGNARGKRDSIARVLPKWKDSEPCKSYLYGMHAFGLEECLQYREAESEARKALTLCSRDAWATHALAHVFEMQTRTKESRYFLESTVEDWERAQSLACHIHWHRAATYIDEGNYEAAVSIFDEHINSRALSTGSLLDYVDAASALLRLELQGVNVGNRWHELPDARVHIHDHAVAFNDAHYTMALVRAGHLPEADALQASIEEYVKVASPSSRHIYEKVGKPLCASLRAYFDQDYDMAVKLLSPLQDTIHAIAGSKAQLDIFTQVLIDACIRSGTEENLTLAKIVLAKRDYVKQAHSGISDRLRARIQSASFYAM